ncbi:MAG: MarR family winged helix-turn-helix transcriptional regulator [Janthinobacterium lividum]
MDALPYAADCNCFAIRQAARYITQLYERHMGRVGLSAAQFTILNRVDRTAQLTTQQLAEAMVMERTTLLRALKPLQRDGLVETLPSATNRRATSLVLTDAGRSKIKAARLCWADAQREFEEQFGAKRAKALRRELFEMTAA